MPIASKTEAHTASENKAAVAHFSPPRLPWAPAIEERFGVDRSSWKALVEAVYPLASSVDSVVLALSYCKARRLDPFKHPVHIVPIWNKEKGKMVDTIWPGIAEHRTTAFRTGQYAGADATDFGPSVTRVFTGPSREGEMKAEVTFPEWCQITVYRMIGDHRVPIPGPRVYWLETYSRIGRTDIPNEMWQKRPNGQLEKCAEAAALRKAFPEEIGDEITSDEAAGMPADTMRDVTPARPQRSDFRGEPAKAPAPGTPKEAPQEPAPPESEASQERPANSPGIYDPESGEVVETEPTEEQRAEWEKVASYEAWGDATIRRIDTTVDIAKIDDFLARNQAKLAEIQVLAPDVSMAVIGAAEARKR